MAPGALIGFAPVLPALGPGPARVARIRVHRAWKVLPVILTLAIVQGVATAQTYRWVDEQGELHVSDDVSSIPPKYRPRVAPPAVDSMKSAKPPAFPAPGGAAPARRGVPGGSGVALWLRTGGLRGQQSPVLIRVYESEQECRAERDRRTAEHVRQGMRPTNQPGLAISNIGGTPAGDTYFVYQCAPAGIRPP